MTKKITCLRKYRAFPKLSALLLCLAAVESPLVLAKESNSFALEEVIITAQRREQDISKVPIAVSAFSGNQLRDMSVNRTTDLVDMVPGLSLSGSGAGESVQYTLRGVTQNDFAEIAEGPVALYVDDVYIPNLQGQNLGIYDIERVEVLKGPQGTLFGRNATGGLVHYVVAKPTDELEGYGELTYGRFDQLKFEGAVSGPITDTISGRLSGLYEYHDEVWENVYPYGIFAGSAGPTAEPCCEDLGGNDEYSVRAQLEMTPSDSLNVRLSADMNRQTLSVGAQTQRGSVAVRDGDGNLINTLPAPTDAFGYTAPDPKDLKLSAEYAKDDADYANSDNVSLHVEYDLGEVQLISITSARYFEKKTLLDADASPGNIFGFGSQGEASNWAEELRLTGGDDTLTWNAGLYYLSITTDFQTALLFPDDSVFAGGPGSPGIDLTNRVQLDTETASVFGQIEWLFSTDFTLNLGLRSIYEKQDYDYSAGVYAEVGSYNISWDSSNLLSPLITYTDDRSDTLWAGKAQISYIPNDDLLIYAGVSRGVKGGNYNVPLAPSGPLDEGIIPYGAEVLWSYEVGTKVSFWDGKGKLDAAAYYYDYDDYQAYSIQTFVNTVSNKPATIYGGEFGLYLRPLSELSISLLGSVYHAEIEDIVKYGSLPAVTTRPSFAPQSEFTAVVGYTFPGAIANGNVTIMGNVSYKSSYYTNIQNYDNQLIDSYTVVDTSIKWESQSEEFSVKLFADNIFDERSPNILVDLTEACGCTEMTFINPRWYGVTVGYQF